MKKTKIVCTMGPRSDDEAIMRALVREGMDVADLTSPTAPMRSRKAAWIC